MLVREAPLYGLDMIERSNGKLKRGLIYVTLSHMEEQGLVRSRYSPAPGGGVPCRRVYDATPFGRHCWRQQTDEEPDRAR